jgi:hypothetical protein
MAKTSPSKKSNTFKACSISAIDKGAHKKYMTYRQKLARSEGEKYDHIGACADWMAAKDSGKSLQCKEIE